MVQHSRTGSDLVLSDIHLHHSSNCTTFALPSKTIIKVNHKLATTLPLVGLQVWAGALLLSEYLVWKRHLFEGKGILELGAGTGLVSQVAGAKDVSAKRVVATDVCIGNGNGDIDESSTGDSVLVLLKQNVELNAKHVKGVHVRELDLTNDAFPLFSWPFQQSIVDVTQGGFGFTTFDLDWFHNECTVILGADIIYVDFVTFHLVKRIPKLLLKKQRASTLSPTIAENNSIWESRTLYLALEKRIQFCKDECKVAAPAWDFLVRTIDAMNLDMEERIKDDGEELDLDFPHVQICMDAVDLEEMPQLFEYERAKELQLYAIYLSINS
ncbi:UNVERIFIED_CONTAM: hypothetical protein HDU68_010099 [Siphonaria sp. JEL0065]|nr:hypothetical protein HDU68_010099 [Siphonaria sp. JEL0065]